MTVSYSKAEQFLLDNYPNMIELRDFEIESLAKDIVNLDYESVGFAIEFGRCPSTDNRTYILHTGYNGHASMERYFGFDWLLPKELQHLKEQ